MSSNNNSSYVQLPPDLAGNLYLILSSSSIPTQAPKPVHHASITGENLQPLVPVRPTTVIHPQSTSQHVPKKLEKVAIPVNDVSRSHDMKNGHQVFVEQNSQANEVKTSRTTEQNRQTNHAVVTNYVHIPDRVVKPRAVATLPECLRMRRNGIYPRYRLAARTRFGPLLGQFNRLLEPEVANSVIAARCAANKPVFLMKRNSEHVLFVDVADKDKCNWFSLLPLGDATTANVWLYEENGELYGLTSKVVPSRTPLTLGYSKAYAEEHRLPAGVPIFDLHNELGAAKNPATSRWQCTECNTEMGSHILLARHLYKHRVSATRKSAKAKSRCSQCKRVFSSKFSLRRHVVRGSCVMNPKTDRESADQSPDQSMETEPKPREQCPSPITEESRPSDESLQNYTAGLDISTNLFDPDRMPNLDASGNDFNPLSWLSTGKEDILAANDVGYAMFSRDLMTKCKGDPVVKTKPKTEEVVICPYCKKNVSKSKHQQHFRECSSKKLQCVCGKVFYKKNSLAVHLNEKHDDRLVDKLKTKENKVEMVEVEVPAAIESPYDCEECDSTFKRRGMLVNHMWREHNRKVSLPVQRCERLYPCVACPKVYRTAAKRKRHTGVHHPGVEVDGRSHLLVGARMSRPAAACPACPRQYATRAKLSQHARSAHPELDPSAL